MTVCCVSRIRGMWVRRETRYEKSRRGERSLSRRGNPRRRLLLRQQQKARLGEGRAEFNRRDFCFLIIFRRESRPGDLVSGSRDLSARRLTSQELPSLAAIDSACTEGS